MKEICLLYVYQEVQENKHMLYVRAALKIYVILIALGGLIYISYNINVGVHELIL